MSKVKLAPDALEMQLATKINVVRPCPFCGRHPLMYSYVNEGATRTLYQARLQCMFPCMAELIENMPSRAEAQQAVIAKWNGRAPALTDRALTLVWRAALTSACNHIIETSTERNADDCSSDVLEALGECSDKLKSWMEPDAEFLQQLRELIAPAPIAPPSEVSE